MIPFNVFYSVDKLKVKRYSLPANLNKGGDKVNYSGKRGRPTKPDTEQRIEARSSVEATAALVSQDTLDEMTAAIGRLYSVEEAAAYLHVTTRSILAYLKDGRLRGVKAGGKWQISADNLRRYVNGE